jgi:hypothetical protein
MCALFPQRDTRRLPPEATMAPSLSSSSSLSEYRNSAFQNIGVRVGFCISNDRSMPVPAGPRDHRIVIPKQDGSLRRLPRSREECAQVSDRKPFGLLRRRERYSADLRTTRCRERLVVGLPIEECAPTILAARRHEHAGGRCRKALAAGDRHGKIRIRGLFFSGPDLGRTRVIRVPDHRPIAVIHCASSPGVVVITARASVGVRPRSAMTNRRTLA